VSSSQVPFGWQELIDHDVGVRVGHPSHTVSGAPIRVARTVRPESRLHLSSADQSVYVELVRLPGMTLDIEYRLHRRRLERRFGPDSVSDVEPGTLSGYECAVYSFNTRELRRVVTSIAVGDDIVRVVVDPSSQLNNEIMARIAVDPDDFHDSTAARRADIEEGPSPG